MIISIDYDLFREIGEEEVKIPLTLTAFFYGRDLDDWEWEVNNPEQKALVPNLTDLEREYIEAVLYEEKGLHSRKYWGGDRE